LDFGLARPLPGSPRARDCDPHTLPGLIVGTAGYLAPEQARCQGAVAASDLFAFGAMLHELLTGERAFQRETTVETRQAVIEHEPPPPSAVRSAVPRWLDAVTARCLAKETRDRFQSARDLAFVLTSRPSSAPAPSRRRGRTALVAVAVVGAVAAAAGAA